MVDWLTKAFMWCVIFPALLMGGFNVVGMTIENIERYNTENAHCLKSATNGYEIKKCG